MKKILEEKRKLRCHGDVPLIHGVFSLYYKIRESGVKGA